MLRDVSTFGCLPAGIAVFIGGFFAAWFNDPESGLESVFGFACFGWFLFLGLPIVLGFLLARAQRNRNRNPIRNALVGGFLAGIVAVVFVVAVIIPILPILALGIFQAALLWFVVGAVLAAISAGGVTTYHHGREFASRRKKRRAQEPANPTISD